MKNYLPSTREDQDIWFLVGLDPTVNILRAAHSSYSESWVKTAEEDEAGNALLKLIKLVAEHTYDRFAKKSLKPSDEFKKEEELNKYDL